jgi:hypothetical protein
VRERGGARRGVRAPAAEGLGPKGLRPEGERERGTNDSEIFMNLGAGGGVRARFFETLARYDFIGLNNLHL